MFYCVTWHPHMISIKARAGARSCAQECTMRYMCTQTSVRSALHTGHVRWGCSLNAVWGFGL